MADQKLTTAEILALARRQGAMGGPSGDGPETAPASEPPAAAAEEVASKPPAVEEAPTKPVAKPTSTADILAAARAQKSGEAATPAKPSAKPKSTADILAAARGQGGGAEAKPAATKPKSTADILAAARGQGGGGAATPASKPAAAKASPKAAPAARAAGERPSVAEMVKAAREGKPAGAAAAPAKPRLPSKPKLPAKAKASDADRRSFFGKAVQWVTEPFMAGWAAMIAIGGLWSLATARFMMPNMIVEPPTKFKIGPPSDYPLGTVSTKWTATRGIWVVHTESYNGQNLIYALLSVCTHLGCTPNWLDGEQKFKCPCHGSGFYINGINFEGPAPRPLERVGLRLAEDGMLEVDKSVKFQEELGQWADPASFVELA